MSELRGEMGRMETRLRGDMETMEVRLRGEMNVLREDVRHDIDALRIDIQDIRRGSSSTARQAAGARGGGMRTTAA